MPFDTCHLFLCFQCVPYLIAMGTDPEPTMRNKADQQLVEIDKKYTGFIHVSLVHTHTLTPTTQVFTHVQNANAGRYEAINISTYSWGKV